MFGEYGVSKRVDCEWEKATAGVVVPLNAPVRPEIRAAEAEEDRLVPPVTWPHVTNARVPNRRRRRRRRRPGRHQRHGTGVEGRGGMAPPQGEQRPRNEHDSFQLASFSRSLSSVRLDPSLVFFCPFR